MVYRGSTGIAPHIPNFGPRTRLMVNCTLRPLYTDKEPWELLTKRLGFREEKTYFAAAGI
jgi:hypothetical protein